MAETCAESRRVKCAYGFRGFVQDHQAVCPACLTGAVTQAGVADSDPALLTLAEFRVYRDAWFKVRLGGSNLGLVSQLIECRQPQDYADNQASALRSGRPVLAKALRGSRLMCRRAGWSWQSRRNKPVELALHKSGGALLGD